MAVIGSVQQLALVEPYVDSGGITRVRDSFRVTPSFGAVYYQSVDFGFPEVRASVQDNPQADGTYDETRYVGARSVAITGIVVNKAFGDHPAVEGWDTSIGWNSASWWCRLLSSWASPARRSRIFLTDDSGVSRFMDVRGDSFTSVIERGSHNYRAWQIGFVNPSGKVYSYNTGTSATADGRTRVVIRQETIAQAGRIYPIGPPYLRNYPSAATPGQTAVMYRGTVSTGFVANVYSGATGIQDPRLTVTSPTGVQQSIGISGYAVPPNTVVKFDTAERTVTTSGGVSLDQYKTAPLQWPQLHPGRTGGSTASYNRVGFSITRGDTNSYVEILYNDADME